MRHLLVLAMCWAATLLVAVPPALPRRVKKAALPTIIIKEGTLVPRLEVVDAREGRKLDIVIAHYHTHTVKTTINNWTRFLQLEKVKELQPVVFVYSLNDEVDPSVFQPLVAEEGTLYRIVNAGREGAVYLGHIINYWNNLAEHTICSQAVADSVLTDRFKHLFTPKTGVLALALYAHQKCGLDDGWLPKGQLVQLYSLYVRRFCTPEGYSAMFRGQFVVSKRRIQAQPKEVYEHVYELLTAPIYHWIHTVHSNPKLASVSNPFFGHSVERGWSLVFGCHDLYKYEQCSRCDNNKWKDCEPEACQCLDE